MLDVSDFGEHNGSASRASGRAEELSIRSNKISIQVVVHVFAGVRVHESDCDNYDLRSDVDASSPMIGLDRNLESKLMALSLFW